MVDISLKSKGNVRFRFYPDNAFANFNWPTVAELNAGQELEGVTDWDNFEIGAQASETTDRVPIKAKAAVARRAAANYGGTASFYYPGYKADTTNLAALVYALMKKINVNGYLVTSIDGEIGESGQPAASMAFANGDYVSVLRVVTDEWDDSITGEELFYYTRTFLKNGGLAIYTVASTAAPVLALTGTAPATAVGSKGFVTATVNGRDFTRGVRYSSSAPNLVRVSATGILTRVAAGTATITATLPNATGVTSTFVVPS